MSPRAGNSELRVLLDELRRDPAVEKRIREALDAEFDRLQVRCARLAEAAVVDPDANRVNALHEFGKRTYVADLRAYMNRKKE